MQLYRHIMRAQSNLCGDTDYEILCESKSAILVVHFFLCIAGAIFLQFSDLRVIRLL